MESSVITLLEWLSLPAVGLPAVGVISFVSATLIPMGSEPVVFGYVMAFPDRFWWAILVATLGNTSGGILNWWLGRAARAAKESFSHATGSKKALINRWFERFGPKTLLLSWLPVVGDPICALAGWARLPLGVCTVYMAIGKFCRYVVITGFLLWIPSHYWQNLLFKIQQLIA